MIRHTTAIKQINAMGFHAFHHEGEGDVVKVSAEHGDGAADYYREGHHLLVDAAREFGWDSDRLAKEEAKSGFSDNNVSKKLNKWAEKNGLYWEWDNPGTISAYEA